jgi:hypothetical protein
MAKQAEAEREKRAKIIHAEGELQASVQLAQAANIIASQPSTLQLRYLQTLTEIAVEKNSTIIFPLPLDLLEPFLQTARHFKEATSTEDGYREPAPPPTRPVNIPAPPPAVEGTVTLSEGASGRLEASVPQGRGQL